MDNEISGESIAEDDMTNNWEQPTNFILNKSKKENQYLKRSTRGDSRTEIIDNMIALMKARKEQKISS